MATQKSLPPAGRFAGDCPTGHVTCLRLPVPGSSSLATVVIPQFFRFCRSTPLGTPLKTKKIAAVALLVFSSTLRTQ